MTIKNAQDSWGRIANGGEHAARVEGGKFADVLNTAITAQVQNIAGENGVDFNPSGLSQSR